MAENGFAHLPNPLENFQIYGILKRISSHVFKNCLHSDSLLHMIPYQIEKEKERFELQKECIRLSNYSNYSYSQHAGYLSYT